MNLTRWTEPGRRGDGLALLGGALLPLAFAPFNLYPLAFLCPAILFLLLDGLGQQPRRAALRGGLFGIGYFGVGVSWVYVAIHDFGFTAAPLAVLLTALFVLAMAAFPALYGYLAVRLKNGLRLPGHYFFLLCLPLLWLLMEWLRAWLFTGFPWLSLGYSQSDSPLAGWAPVLGVYGMGLWLAVTAGAVALALKARKPALVLLVLPLWLAGEGLKYAEWSHPSGEPMSVALVQGNLPQLTKWDEARVYGRLDTYADLSEPLLGQFDLVVWPENAITVFYHEYKADYFDGLEALAKASGSDLLLGVPLLDEDGVRYYTTLMNIGPSGQQFYKKDHLVPFGEYVPFESLLRGLIAFFDLPMSGFSPGGEDQPLLALDGQRAALTICYEDLFPHEALRHLPEATLMINGSNNAWYGDSLAPHQHLQISRMRALESARPVIRATTNGISALIGHDGRVTSRSAQFRQSVLRGEVQPRAGQTPYVFWGEWANLFVASLMLLSLYLVVRKNRRQPAQKTG